jgi:hypothetical protein
MASQQGGQSFLTSLQEVNKKTSVSKKSKVDLLLVELEDSNKEMLEDLKTALADTQFSASNISVTLKDFGYQISDSSIKRWRQQNNG